MESRARNRAFYFNIIIICLIIILFIFALAWLGRFDNLESASDLFNNLYWIVATDFGVAFKYAWRGGTAPAITIIFLTLLIVYLCHVYISSIVMDSKIRAETKELVFELNELRQKTYDDKYKLQDANKARDEAISLLEDKTKEFNKKTLEFAQIASKNNKYVRFYNENSEKIANSEKILQVKDSKITELEEIIKRRDLQIQRLKKSRKESN